MVVVAAAAADGDWAAVRDAVAPPPVAVGAIDVGTVDVGAAVVVAGGGGVLATLGVPDVSVGVAEIDVESDGVAAGDPDPPGVGEVHGTPPPDAPGVAEGQADGVVDVAGVVVEPGAGLVADDVGDVADDVGDVDGDVDALTKGEGDPLTGGDVEGVAVGDREGEALGAVVGTDEGDEADVSGAAVVDPGPAGSPPFMTLVSTATELPFNHGSGSVN